MGSSIVGVGCISAEFMGGEERFDDIGAECGCELREGAFENPGFLVGAG